MIFSFFKAKQGNFGVYFCSLSNFFLNVPKRIFYLFSVAASHEIIKKIIMVDCDPSRFGIVFS